MKFGIRKEGRENRWLTAGGWGLEKDRIIFDEIEDAPTSLFGADLMPIDQAASNSTVGFYNTYRDNPNFGRVTARLMKVTDVE